MELHGPNLKTKDDRLLLRSPNFYEKSLHNETDAGARKRFEAVT